MQIHEITKHNDTVSLVEVTLPSEWVGQKAKSAASSVAKGLGRAASAVGNTAPFKKAAAVMNTPGALTDPGAYASAMNKYYQDDNARLQAQYDQKKSSRVASQTQQRAAQLTNQWLQQVRTSTGSPSPADAPRAAPGQMPAGVAKSAQGKKMQQAYGQPRGGIQGMQSDLQEESTIPAQRFRQWADGQLATQMTGTNNTITMDQVRQQDKQANQQLNAILATIAKTPMDPVAVENYFMTAMTAMQKMAAQMKKTRPVANAGATTQSVVSPLSLILSPKQIEDVKTMCQDPVKARAIKSELGLR
jgi:hypothetical protein